jgi:hypothetical protein
LSVTDPMNVRTLVAFAAGFVAAGILGFVGIRADRQPTCEAGDLTRAVSREKADEMEKTFGAWVHRVRVCRIGDYLVNVSTNSAMAGIMVARNGAVMFTASPKRTSVVEQNRVVYEFNHVRNEITYAAFNAERGVWIENIDLNADGTPDLRRAEAPGRTATQEMRIGDHWLELVMRDGRSGTVFNGQFMSFDEARKQLGVPAPNQVGVTK